MPKVAIEIRKTYNGVAFPPEYRICTDREAQKIAEHAQQDKETYELNQQRKDRLSGPTVLTITTGDLGSLPYEVNTRIVTRFHYNYETPKGLGKKSSLMTVLKLGMLIFLACIVINIVLLYQAGEVAQIEAMCRVYLDNGTPSYMIVNGKKYDLDAYGDVVAEQQMFINPWHQEDINNKAQNCAIFNTER